MDLVYRAADGRFLVNRMESCNGLHTLEHGEEIGLGSRTYSLVSIDNRDKEQLMSKKTTKQRIFNLVLAAMFLAIGIVLPFFTGQIPQIGRMLLPMHLPVLLCGLICGWQYGGVVGFILPLLRYALVGMPPMPNGLAMAFELAAYGAIVGLLYSHSRWQCVISLYRSLLAAMVGGRLVWAAVRVVMTGVTQVPFTWEIFLADALISAIPGIILQLVFIPVMMVALDRTGLVHFRKEVGVPVQG